MAAQFGNLLKNIVTNPDQKISDFPWLTGDQARRIRIIGADDAEAVRFWLRGPISRPITQPIYVDKNS